MNILIMGSGAVGGYFGSVLHRAGQNVKFIARGAHLEAIRTQGLKVESASSGDFVIYPEAMERPDGTWIADLVLFCVKSYHNEQAIDVIRLAVGDDTTILTLQNGIGGGDQLADAFGEDRVLLGAAYVEAARIAPGVIEQTGSGPRIVYGESDGTLSARVGAIKDVLVGAGVDGVPSDDVRKALWQKLIYICALSGMTCITRSEFAEVISTPETLELTWRVAREANAVARAVGIDTDSGIVEQIMAEFESGMADMVSSMYTDLKAGNPLEVSVINGAVSKNGKLAGVETPVNDFITACLTISDRSARVSKGLA